MTKASGNPHIAGARAAYGMPGVEVDGNDVLAVYQAAGEAVARARAGGGPTLIECKTYRTRAHAEGMRDAGYRTPRRSPPGRSAPVKRFRDRLLADGRATEAELDAIEAEVKALVEEAGEFAEASPLPDPATVTDHVYAGQLDARSWNPNQQPAPAASFQQPHRELTFVEAAREGLAEEMARDPGSSWWVRASGRAAATSTPPSACTSATARSGCATRPSASAASPPCAPARRSPARGRSSTSCSSTS